MEEDTNNRGEIYGRQEFIDKLRISIINLDNKFGQEIRSKDIYASLIKGLSGNYSLYVFAHEKPAEGISNNICLIRSEEGLVNLLSQAVDKLHSEGHDYLKVSEPLILQFKSS